MMRSVLLLAIGALPLLLLDDGLRQPLEGHMGVHMGLLPLVAASGWAFARVLCSAAERRRSPMAAFDAQAVFSLTTVSCVSAFWMLPLTLDLSLLWPLMGLAKYLSLWLSGGLLAMGIARLGPETSAFFAGNAVLMLATSGLLYLEADTRLCLSYRIDDQFWAGLALLAMAALLGLAVITRLLRPREPASA